MTTHDSRSQFRSVRPTLRGVLAVGFAVGAFFSPGLTGSAFGQARPAGATPTPRAAPATGLDALGDEKVMDELAGRGLNSLLDRLFDDRKVSTADRDSFKALQAIRELGSNATLANDDRRIELLKKSTDGLVALKSKLNDPTQLIEYAATLLTRGVKPDVNILDYWGDNPVRQARIALATKLAVEMLNKAADDSFARYTILQNKITSAKDPNLQECERLEAQANGARYVANSTAIYYRVVSIDVVANKAGFAERKRLADPAIRYLGDLANNESNAAPAVILMIGRLNMAKGEYPAAKKQFQLVINKKVEVEGKLDAMTPAPTDFQENEARYFSIVCDVLAKKLAEADQGYLALEAWQKGVTNPEFKSEAMVKANAAQLLMLKYRIASAKADVTVPGPERDKLNRDSETALDDLTKLSDGFRTLVAEQLVGRVKDDTDLTKISTQVLLVLIGRGNVERLKPENDTSFDGKVLNRGLQAAQVIAARKPGEAGVTLDIVDNAKVFIPLFLQKQGKLLEAANLFLDYAVDPLSQGRPNAPLMVDAAYDITLRLYSKDPKSVPNSELYDRLLKIACNRPYEHPQLFFYYADRLRTRAQNDVEALKFYAKVAKGDKKEYDARYWQMVLSEQQLAKIPNPVLKNQQMLLVLNLGEQVRALAQTALAAPGADAMTQDRAKFRIAYVTLMTADLALKQTPPQPKRTIEVLEGFEKAVEGMSQVQGLVSQAAFLRARAMIAAGQTQDAIAQVQQMANNKDTADFAVKMVQDLLERLEKKITAAKDAGDKLAMGNIANDRAKLSGLLMPFAEKQADPKKKEELKRSITYYDANAKFSAGQLLPDGTDAEKELKHQRLKEALDIFLKLQVDNKDDTRVAINICKCQYELGDYVNAVTGYATLLMNQKLGAPTILVNGIGGNPATEQDNPDYWESIYKLNMARYILAQKNPGDTESQKMLDAARRTILPLFTVNGDKTGGAMHDDYVKLRDLLVPNSGSQTQPTGPGTAPTTVPAP